MHLRALNTFSRGESAALRFRAALEPIRDPSHEVEFLRELDRHEAVAELPYRRTLAAIESYREALAKNILYSTKTPFNTLYSTKRP